MADPAIPAYLDCLSRPLLDAVRASHQPVSGFAGLTVDADLLERFPELHSADALGLLGEVWRATEPALRELLRRRADDRAQLDAWTLEARERNRGVPFTSAAYVTAVGRPDAEGRVLLGPAPTTAPVTPVTLPAALGGPAVTLFGPPDDAKMCVYAMNALHRRRADEPPLVTQLVESSTLVPRWGADSEDSKTPFVADLLQATLNLGGCYDASLTHHDARSGRTLTITPERRAVPIKRIPGLAIPAGTHQVDGAPLPLHLLDLVLHMWHARHLDAARVFYVPKLENEEEAAYVRALLAHTERAIHARDPSYQPGLARVFVVFESPRAIFRVAEMAEALHPYFAGGSLGWHDLLAATARLFRHDPGYRIPVKADPDIVIHHIKESHVRLAQTLAPRGAVSIGGMYGTLFTDGDAASFRVSMVGYVRDVVSQLRRGLDGFWVAHPDFVRIGVALVEAWRRDLEQPDQAWMERLVSALVPDPVDLDPLLSFLRAPDIEGLAPDDPLYHRALIAADSDVSTVIANDDPDEVRYNIFQALQYLAAWLGGTGCVALPATLPDAAGRPVVVRVMDDLATTERSRWELWAEVHHGRVGRDAFRALLDDEVAFLREGEQTPTKRIQVAWEGAAARWYPVAIALLELLVLHPNPPESVTELLLPFTFPAVRDAADPLGAARHLCPGRYELPA